MISKRIHLVFVNKRQIFIVANSYMILDLKSAIGEIKWKEQAIVRKLA